MSQKSKLVALLAILIMACFAIQAEARTWTDRSGRTIEGDFIRLDGTNVIIRRQGKEVTIALDRLCDADQEFARSAKPGAAAGDASEDPFAASDSGKEGGKASEDSDDEPDRDRSGKYPLRNWRDRSGLSVRARFIAVQGQDIILERNNGLRLNVPFFTLVESDQEYVEKELRKAGTAHLTPSRAPPQNNAGTGPGGAPPGGYGPQGGSVSPPMGSPQGTYSSPPGNMGAGGSFGPPGGFAGPGNLAPPPKGGAMPPPGGYSTPPGGIGTPGAPPFGSDSPPGAIPPGGYATPPSGAPPGGYASPPSGAPPGGFGTPSPNSPPATPPSGSAPPGGYAGTPSTEFNPPTSRGPIGSPFSPFAGPTSDVVYTCSNCSRELPRSVKEGDQCPYCKIRFLYKQEPSGKKVYAQVYKDRMTAFMGIGVALGSLVVIGIVIGVIVQAVRN